MDNNTLLYPQSERYIYYNEAQQVLNLLSGLLQTSVLVPTGSQIKRVWYDVPSPILIPLKVQFNGTYLHKSSLSKIGQTNPSWLKDTTANLGHPTASWIPVGLTKFGIHPADSIGGADLLVTGIQDPVQFTSSSQTIPFPNEYLEAMEDLSAFSIQLKEGFPILQAAITLYQKFLSKMTENNRWRDNISMPAYGSEIRSNK